MRTLLALAALLVPPLAGCSSSDDDVECVHAAVDCTFAGSASMVIGEGSMTTGFVDVSDGDSLLVVLGPQGLYMATPAIRVQNMWAGCNPGRTDGPSDPEIYIEIRESGAAVGGSGTQRIGLIENIDGLIALDIWVPWNDDEWTDADAGRSFTLHGEVSDACGRSAADQLDFVAVLSL